MPTTNPLMNPHTGMPVQFSPVSDDPMNAQRLLRLAGLWNGPAQMNVNAGGERMRGANSADQNALLASLGVFDPAALEGYTAGSGRQDYNLTDYLLDPSGSLVTQDTNYDRESMNGDEWASAIAKSLATVGAVYGAGTGLESLMGAGGASGVGGLSGMDLAADAGMGAFGGGGGSAAAGGIGTLGTLPALPAGVGSISTLPTIGAGAAGIGAIPSVAGGGGIMGTLGSIGSSLTSPSGLANLASAGLGLYGQNQALGAMEDATNQANEFQRYAFDTIRADNKPLVDLRNSVLPQIQGLLSNPGSITSDPGYQFQFAEGQKALNNSAAGRGMTYSGAQGKALQRYGNDYGATKLDQSLNRLTSVAGLGQVGSNSNNAATQNYANNAAGNALQQGSARGSAYGNMAGIANNALLNIFDQNQFRNLFGGGS